MTQTFETRIRGISSDGSGVGRHPDGRTVFVPRTAPGDLVRVEVTKDKKRWVRGEVESLVAEGPDRVIPPCPHYARCGGCSLQHLSTEAQRLWKVRFVVDALERIAGVTVASPPIVGDQAQLEYRNRLSFSIRSVRGETVAGFRMRGAPKQIVPVKRCLLGDPAIQGAWTQLYALRDRLLEPGREARLTLRSDPGGVTLVVSRGYLSIEPEELLELAPALNAVWRVVRGRLSLLALRAGKHAGRGTAFAQVNAGVGSRLHRHVVASIDPAQGKRVIEAYAGTGEPGRVLAGKGADVIGIEFDPFAVRLSQGMPTDGYSVIEGRVEEELGRLLPADVVILNPPRTGVEPPVVEALLQEPPADIIYVSCDPATLARDVARFGAEYGVAAIRLFDLFPQTSHVETVLHLKRGMGD